MLSAIASVSSAGAVGEEEAVLAEKAQELMGTLVDPAGTFYRFSLAKSLLVRSRQATHSE